MKAMGAKTKPSRTGILDLPDELVVNILDRCDSASVRAMGDTCVRFNNIVAGLVEDMELECDKTLDELPSEILLMIFSFLDRPSLGKVAGVCHRFKDLAYADCLWMRQASGAIAASTAIAGKTLEPLGARDRVRVSENWRAGKYLESKLLVQNVRYMPRLQLEREVLWVSWGNKIWAHPRFGNDGHIGRTTTKVLKGHTDDVSRFVVRDGLLVSGGSDRTLFGWDSTTGEFLFAKRYCHGSEISAVDVASGNGSGYGYQQTVVTGSRDRSIKIWSLNSDSENDINRSNVFNNNQDERQQQHQKRHYFDNFPAVAQTVNLGDRIWSVAADPIGKRVAIGSAGLGGVPALHILDLPTAGHAGSLVPLGEHDLKKGAGVLDLHWLTEQTFLGCGYDAFTRLWDVRVGGIVRSWEEPFDEPIYCLSTDNVNTLVCGTARHGLVRLWDLRNDKQHVQMFYAKHAHAGQSSPVYSVAFDQANLYVALDQCLNLMSFSGSRWDDAITTPQMSPPRPPLSSPPRKAMAMGLGGNGGSNRRRRSRRQHQNRHQ